MSSSWPLVLLSSVLTQDRSYIYELEDRTYPKLSVKLYGRGCVLDGNTDGKNVKMKRHQLAKPGQVILSEIWGKKGAIGIVPEEGDGALVTSHFFLFDIDSTKVMTDWLLWLTKANYFENELSIKAKGSTGYAAVRPNQFLALSIPLPSLEDQRRIVEKILYVTARLEDIISLQRLVDQRITQSIHSLLNSYGCKNSENWVELGEVLRKIEDLVYVDDEQEYQQVTVRMHHQGLVLRRKCRGKEIKTKKQYKIHAGQFIFSRIDARNGAMGLVSALLDKSIVSNDFPVFETDKNRLDPRFLNYYSSTDAFMADCSAHSKGTSNRQRIKEESFLQIKIPLPPLDLQLRIITIAERLEELRELQGMSGSEMDGLLKSILDRAFQGKI